MPLVRHEVRRDHRDLAGRVDSIDAVDHLADVIAAHLGVAIAITPVCTELMPPAVSIAGSFGLFNRWPL